MKEILWKKLLDCESLCDVKLYSEDAQVRTLIENYLVTVNLFNEKQTGIGPPIWQGDSTVYIMPIEFEHLIMMAYVFGIEFVEEV